MSKQYFVNTLQSYDSSHKISKEQCYKSLPVWSSVGAESGTCIPAAVSLCLPPKVVRKVASSPVGVAQRGNCQDL